MDAQTIVVNGVEYTPKSKKEFAPEVNGMKYCIIRTYSAGVFAGYLGERNGAEGIIHNSRRLYYWNGAASLSQLAMEGVTKPQECKFAMEVPETTLINIIEIIPCTAVAEKNIKAVPTWKV